MKVPTAEERRAEVRALLRKKQPVFACLLDEAYSAIMLEEAGRMLKELKAWPVPAEEQKSLPVNGGPR